MGVPSVWDIISDGFDERLPFIVLVTNFYKEHKRPLRIAIDAFQWIFEATGSDVSQFQRLNSNAQTARLLQIFHSRIKTLISLNVSFIFVFDGPFKPYFKRNHDVQREDSPELEEREFDDEYMEFQRSLHDMDDDDNYTRDLKYIRQLKKELKRWNISYVESPAEAEAEAANLQKKGIVDYVLSNDSDAIIFGATKILRNFSKFEEDKPAGASTMKTKSSTYYWCTPVDLEEVKSKTGYDQWRVLLYSILVGADYNQGVKGLGSERASQVALSSTNYMKKHIATCPYEDFPDFAFQLMDIYYRPDGELPDPIERKQQYKDFQSKMFGHISGNIVEYFNRREKSLMKEGAFDNFPPDYVVMLYFYPLLKTDSFQFTNGMTNFAETDDAQSWIDSIKFDKILRHHTKNVPPNVLNVDLWLIKSFSKAYLLKHIIYDLVIDGMEFEKQDTKEIGTFDLDMFSVRYHNYLPEHLIESTKDSDTQKPKKGYLEWIPSGLVPQTSRYYKDYIEREEQKRREEQEKANSPKKRLSRKKKPTQATTLLSMGFIDTPKDKPKGKALIQKRKSVSAEEPKSKSNVLDMLKVSSASTKSSINTLPSVPQLNPEDPNSISPKKRTNLFVTDSDDDRDEDEEEVKEDTFGSDVEFEDELIEMSSPMKTIKHSPTKIESTIKSTIQESPIKSKSRKKSPNSSPSKGNRAKYLQELDDEAEQSFSSAKKKLDFSDIKSSTPNKLNPINRVRASDASTSGAARQEDISVITLSDTSMINSSDIREISHISTDQDPISKDVSKSVSDTNIENTSKDKTTPSDHSPSKKFNALDAILEPMEFSSDESNDSD